MRFTAGSTPRQSRCWPDNAPRHARGPGARTLRAALQQAQAAGGKADYWTMAALAEAELIGGNLPAAQDAYRRALPLAEGNWRELSSTRRQARLLAQALGLEADFVEGLFPPLGIAVFAAPPLPGGARDEAQTGSELRSP